MKKFLVKWSRKALASGLFIGYFPVMPGTAASALVAGLVWFGAVRHPGVMAATPALYQWTALVLLAAAGMFVCNGAAELFGREDPPRIVFDELVGQLFTFFMVPLGWKTVLLGFLLFRFFDIVKPYPVYKMEEIEDGAGIMMDDVAAGIWANIVLHLTLYGYHAVKAYL